MASSRTALEEMGSGEFRRKPSTYRERIAKDSPKFKPEAGRYHLYVSYACPWAHRTLIVRALKGLEDAVGVSVVHPTWQRTRPNDPGDKHCGWAFASPDDPPLTPTSGFGSVDCRDCEPDPINAARFVRDLYAKVRDTSGKYTVPVLWDKETGCIVNNESSEIIEMLNTEFDDVAKNPKLDLNPPASRAVQDEVNEWVYPTINNGVYRCGFAQSQKAYDEAVQQLFDSLDRAEEILSRQRYLCGNALTLADVRLYVTLVRFDEVYVVYFKTNKKRITDYPNVHNYLKDLFQTRGFAETTNMFHIKHHYYTSHATLNAYSVVPAGPGVMAELATPHDRSRFGGSISNI